MYFSERNMIDILSKATSSHFLAWPYGVQGVFWVKKLLVDTDM